MEFLDLFFSLFAIKEKAKEQLCFLKIFDKDIGFRVNHLTVSRKFYQVQNIAAAKTYNYLIQW